MIDGLHVHAPPHVVLKIEGPVTKGRGKRRAWCDRCRSLKPRKDFWWAMYAVHPSSHSAFYYGPHWDCMCASCIEKVKPQVMELEEYKRLFKELCGKEAG